MNKETRRIITVRTVNVTTYELDTADGTPVDARTAIDLFHEHAGHQVGIEECTHTIISDEEFSPELLERKAFGI